MIGFSFYVCQRTWSLFSLSAYSEAPTAMAATDIFFLWSRWQMTDNYPYAFWCRQRQLTNKRTMPIYIFLFFFCPTNPAILPKFSFHFVFSTPIFLDICVFSLRRHKFQLVGARSRGGWGLSVCPPFSSPLLRAEKTEKGRSIMTGSRSGLCRVGVRHSDSLKSINYMAKQHIFGRAWWTFPPIPTSTFLFVFFLSPQTKEASTHPRRRRPKGNRAKQNKNEIKEWHARDLFVLFFGPWCRLRMWSEKRR